MTAASGQGPSTARPAPAERAGDTSRENPWPVRALSQRMAQYVAKAPAAWIEGQLAQVNVRPGSSTAFLVLRDTAVDMSMSATCSTLAVTGQARPLREGDRVVVYGKFEFYSDPRQPVAADQRAASGRTRRVARPAAAHPRTARRRGTHRGGAEEAAAVPAQASVGLITGRASAAESDVLANASARWPTVQFRVRNVAIQGTGAVTQIMDALADLDADPDVEVIVLARGGGSVEDLLPFSDETLCRAVSDCRTPGGVGGRSRAGPPDRRRRRRRTLLHPDRCGQTDRPGRGGRAADCRSAAQPGPPQPDHWVVTEQHRLDGVRGRSVLADPLRPIEPRADQLAGLQPPRLGACSVGCWTTSGRTRAQPRPTARPRPGGHPVPRVRRRADVADGGCCATPRTGAGRRRAADQAGGGRGAGDQRRRRRGRKNDRTWIASSARRARTGQRRGRREPGS